jgi:hypothetical protein
MIKRWRYYSGFLNTDFGKDIPEHVPGNDRLCNVGAIEAVDAIGSCNSLLNTQHIDFLRLLMQIEMEV